MDILTTRIATFSKSPEFGSDEYKKWIEQDDFVQFLQTVPRMDEVVLYALTSYEFLYSVLVPTRLVTPPDIYDLDQWGCNPSESWGISVTGGPRPKVFLSPPLDHTQSRTIDQGEQITFVRRFDGRQEERSYIEISQRITHSFGLHDVPERRAYCRFDDHGDLEDVIRVVDFISDNQDQTGRIVTIRRAVLDEYMTMTDQSLVLLFDSTRFDPKNFNGWPGQNVEYRNESPDIWYHIGRTGSNASYIRGFQIIRSALTNKDLVRRYGFGQPSDRQYAMFIAQDWKHNAVHECSCDPKKIGNYFVKSEAPYGTSPVFFRPEVLLKYKADSEKYQIRLGSISCRNAWYLQKYDLNDAGQVFTYLVYLSNLPYDEQLYWKSFNEPPKSPISKRSFEADFEGKWDLQYDPLQSLQQILGDLHEAHVLWWKLRDEALIEKVQYPVTPSADEWAGEIHTLDKLLIEGFVTDHLRSHAMRLGRAPEKDWKSLKLLQEVLLGLGKDETEVRQIVEPLQELNNLRSKVSGHASGAKAKQIKAEILKKHKTYSAHYRQLSARCDASVRKLQTIL